MPTHHSQELEALKQKLLTMASHAESAVSRAVRAVVERDDELARQVKSDDNILDQSEMEMDEMAVTLLAKAPLASDLRLIIVGMKISHDLERVGDEAVKIAKRALELNREPRLEPRDDLTEMSVLGLRMLKEALDAFVRRDPAMARSIIPRDKQVNSLNRQLHTEVSHLMVQQPDTIPGYLKLMVVSKSLERIADHATNIAEEVVYLYEGQDIRHTAKDPAGDAVSA